MNLDLREYVKGGFFPPVFKLSWNLAILTCTLFCVMLEHLYSTFFESNIGGIINCVAYTKTQQDLIKHSRS